MSNILLTGGRAPATLELARAFHRAGHTVFMAESLRGHLSEPSNAIQKNFVIPPPRQQMPGFIKALKDIIVQNKIDLLVPTCEEVFYIAMGREVFPCKVFVDSIQKLKTLHNKWSFVIEAIEHELPIPETILVANQDDLLQAFAQWRGLVLKPVYSRFASRTLVLPPLKKALSSMMFDSPWIAQEHIKGHQYCTYSICHNGHITAHTAYRSEFTAGRGSTVVFQHVDHPATFNWAKTFVKGTQFTGQIAFDFMQTSDGRVIALECNPRTTSGVHLLAGNPEFVNSFFNESMPPITAEDHSSHMLSTAMLLYGLPASVRNGHIGGWFRTFFSSDDVIFDMKDPRPFFLQFRSIFHYLKFAKDNGISPLQASTYDIEWNGEGKK
jgi:predicted ATP-grasp superfamily ATP-dependent carboligase